MLHSLILVLFSSRSFSFEYLSHLFPTTTQVADSSSINCNAQHACTAEMLLIVYHFVQGSFVVKVKLWWRRSCGCCCGGDVGGAGKAMNCGGGDGSCYHNTVPRAVRESQFCRTTKKLSKRKKLSKKRKKDVFRVRLVPLFGNVMLLLLSMMIVVESVSPLPDGNGCPYDGWSGCSRKSTDNTLNSILDRWLDTGTRSAVETDYGPIGDWDVSSVKNFRFLFFNKFTFNTDISKWNVAAAEDMLGMFEGAAKFNGDLTKWITGKVTTMRIST